MVDRWFLKRIPQNKNLNYSRQDFSKGVISVGFSDKILWEISRKISWWMGDKTSNADSYNAKTSRGQATKSEWMGMFYKNK